MKDTIKEVDLILAGIMGYATPDYPKWAWHRMPEDSARLETERGRWRNHHRTKNEYDRFKITLERHSMEKYDLLYPRRPDHWDKVVRAFLKLSEEDRAQITRDGINKLIDYTHPHRAKERKAEDQAKKETKRKTHEIRNRPENKNQPLPTGRGILWNEEGEPVTDNVRNPRRLTASQYNPESVIQRLLRLLHIGPKDKYQKELDKQVSEEIQQTRMKSSAGETHQDTSEYRDGFAGNSGYMPIPGRKPSGRFRRRWGAK